MKISKFFLIFVVLALGFLAFWVLHIKTDERSPEATSNIKTETRQNVESYLRKNISELSPVKPVLGGAWYVVSIDIYLEKHSGVVTYEDGHIQEIRNFSYTVSEQGEVLSLTISNGEPIACTMEAKQCPDGSYVGRTGPNCEFSLCPPLKNKSGVTGTVTLSPTCPVAHIPPEPQCDPQFYQTSINIMKSGTTEIIKTIQSDKNGRFNTDLTPGAYELTAKGGANGLPRCDKASVEIIAGKYTTLNLSCDTGMR